MKKINEAIKNSHTLTKEEEKKRNGKMKVHISMQGQNLSIF